jgi:hypothetical protein
LRVTGPSVGAVVAPGAVVAAGALVAAGPHAVRTIAKMAVKNIVNWVLDLIRDILGLLGF